MDAAEGLRQRKSDRLDKEENISSENATVSTTTWSLKKFLLCITLCISTAIICIDVFIESPIQPISFSLPGPPEFDGVLKTNDILTKAEILFKNELAGPESIVMRDGHIYTGTSDGRLIHIHDGKVETLVSSFGKSPCGTYEAEPTCGRPLGIRFDKDGNLLVLDTYHGLYKVDTSSGNVHQLFSSQTPVDGHAPKFLNDLTIANDGTIYITDSSVSWQRRDFALLVSEGIADGRLLRYDPRTNGISVLYSGLAFANGVQLSSDESHVLVAETARARIMRYHLKGEKSGKMDIFIDNLPGLPDNIRTSSSGGYWIGTASIRRQGKFSPIDAFSNIPWIRRFIFKVMSQQTFINIFKNPYGLLLEIDASGNIIQSFHDTSGQVVPSVSEAEEYQGKLYLGSYSEPGLRKLKIM